MLKKYLIILNLIILNLFVYSQHEADYWYFGNFAGLDFSSGKPEPLTNGQLINYEGCAVASDSSGNLLFYTNGMTVWNKEHQQMLNGEGLFGNTSSTQSSIIVPTPNKPNEYHLFTVDVIGTTQDPGRGLNYSIINMSRGNGLGAVTEIKNNNLLILVMFLLSASFV